MLYIASVAYAHSGLRAYENSETTLPREYKTLNHVQAVSLASLKDCYSSLVIRIIRDNNIT